MNDKKVDLMMLVAGLMSVPLLFWVLQYDVAIGIPESGTSMWWSLIQIVCLLALGDTIEKYISTRRERA